MERRGEIGRASENKLLSDGTLEAMMRLFNVAVFIRAAGIGVRSAETVVSNQPKVSSGEFFRVSNVIDCC